MAETPARGQPCPSPPRPRRRPPSRLPSGPPRCPAAPAPDSDPGADLAAAPFPVPDRRPPPRAGPAQASLGPAPPGLATPHPVPPFWPAWAPPPACPRRLSILTAPRAPARPHPCSGPPSPPPEPQPRLPPPGLEPRPTQAEASPGRVALSLCVTAPQEPGFVINSAPSLARTQPAATGDWVLRQTPRGRRPGGPESRASCACGALAGLRRSLRLLPEGPARCGSSSGPSLLAERGNCVPSQGGILGGWYRPPAGVGRSWLAP